MPRIEIETVVRAPQAVVFDLARSIDTHQQSQVEQQEKAVAGRLSGLIELGESVTWEAVHFGVRQRLTSKITAMQAPSHFRDTMVAGAFKRFDHDHYFETSTSGTTVMRDIFDFTSPFGPIGRVADRLFLTRYMTELLTKRNRVIRELAEAGAPDRIIPTAHPVGL